MNDQQKIEQLLGAQTVMVLAVMLPDGTPWAVPVAIRARDGLKRFEWDSALQTEHSKALIENSKMSIVIFQKQENSQIGYYATGTGELVNEFKPGFGRYRFKAARVWVNDESFVKREVKL